MATKQKINFASVKAAAAKLSENQLVYAINDCLVTIQLQENCGMDVTKYYDQLSVYRPALTKLRKGKRAARDKKVKAEQLIFVCAECRFTVKVKSSQLHNFNFCPYCGKKI